MLKRGARRTRTSPQNWIDSDSSSESSDEHQKKKSFNPKSPSKLLIASFLLVTAVWFFWSHANEQSHEVTANSYAGLEELQVGDELADSAHSETERKSGPEGFTSGSGANSPGSTGMIFIPPEGCVCQAITRSDGQEMEDHCAESPTTKNVICYVASGSCEGTLTSSKAPKSMQYVICTQHRILPAGMVRFPSLAVCPEGTEISQEDCESLDGYARTAGWALKATGCIVNQKGEIYYNQNKANEKFDKRTPVFCKSNGQTKEAATAASNKSGDIPYKKFLSLAVCPEGSEISREECESLDGYARTGSFVRKAAGCIINQEGGIYYNKKHEDGKLNGEFVETHPVLCKDDDQTKKSSRKPPSNQGRKPPADRRSGVKNLSAEVVRRPFISVCSADSALSMEECMALDGYARNGNFVLKGAGCIVNSIGEIYWNTKKADAKFDETHPILCKPDKLNQ